MKKFTINQKQFRKILEQSLVRQDTNSLSDCFKNEGLETPKDCLGTDKVKCKVEILHLLISKKIYAEKAARIVSCVNSKKI